MFLSKNINKIPDLCLRCKTRLTTFDEPTPHFTNTRLENLNDPYDNY